MPHHAVTTALRGMYTECTAFQRQELVRFTPMAKIGNTEYPDIGLQECLHTARTIQVDFGGEIKRGGLAHVLGMSDSGGAFAARLGSMRMWGIIEGRSTLRLTGIANRAIGNGDAETDAESMRSLARNVPLFNDLHTRLQTGIADKAVLAAIVEDLTDAPMAEVNSRLPQIERLFNEVRRYMEPTASERGRSNERGEEFDIGAGAAPRGGQPAQDREPKAATPIKLIFEGGEMVMEETPDNIDLFITALVTRKRKLMQLDDNAERIRDSM